jgi:hypothetical protein
VVLGLVKNLQTHRKSNPLISEAELGRAIRSPDATANTAHPEELIRLVMERRDAISQDTG